MQLADFAADGLELTLQFWIGDPENGQGNVRSDVNLAVLDVLNAPASRSRFRSASCTPSSRREPSAAPDGASPSRRAQPARG